MFTHPALLIVHNSSGSDDRASLSCHARHPDLPDGVYDYTTRLIYVGFCEPDIPELANIHSSGYKEAADPTGVCGLGYASPATPDDEIEVPVKDSGSITVSLLCESCEWTDLKTEII